MTKAPPENWALLTDKLDELGVTPADIAILLAGYWGRRSKDEETKKAYPDWRTVDHFQKLSERMVPVYEKLSAREAVAKGVCPACGDDLDKKELHNHCRWTA